MAFSEADPQRLLVVSVSVQLYTYYLSLSLTSVRSPSNIISGSSAGQIFFYCQNKSDKQHGFLGAAEIPCHTKANQNRNLQ